MQSRIVVHLKVGKERRGECVGLLLTAAGRRCDPKALFVLLWCAGVSCDGAFCLPPRQRLSPAMTSRLSVVARWGWLVLEFGIGSSAPHVWRRPGSKKVEDFSRTWSSRACSGPQLQRAAHHDRQQLQSCKETSNATATSMRMRTLVVTQGRQRGQVFERAVVPCHGDVGDMFIITRPAGRSGPRGGCVGVVVVVVVVVWLVGWVDGWLVCLRVMVCLRLLVRTYVGLVIRLLLLLLLFPLRPVAPVLSPRPV